MSIASVQTADTPGDILALIGKAYPDNQRIFNAFTEAFKAGAGKQFEGKPLPDVWEFVKAVGGAIDDPALKSLLLKGCEIADAIELCRAEPRNAVSSAKLASLQGHARSLSKLVELDDDGRLVRDESDGEERLSALKGAIR